jgi:hypothetical protein
MVSMPNIGELAGDLLGLIGNAISSSSARLGAAATASILLVLLVLLALLARPVTRWTTRDLGRLAALPRALASAAEAGAGAAVSLGTAGVGRSVAAVSRLQTLAALPILAHVATAAARSGVPLEVTTNDPLTVHLAESLLAAAHEKTGTTERAGRSRVAYVGEGRATEAARAMAGAGGAGRITIGPAADHAMSLVVGSLAEEGLLVMHGAAAGDASTIFGTAEASQAPAAMLLGGGRLIGPELFDASAELGPGAVRASVLAGNQLLALAALLLVIGSLLQLLGVLDIAGFLVGRA